MKQAVLEAITEVANTNNPSIFARCNETAVKVAEKAVELAFADLPVKSVTEAAALGLEMRYQEGKVRTFCAGVQLLDDGNAQVFVYGSILPAEGLYVSLYAIRDYMIQNAK